MQEHLKKQVLEDVNDNNNIQCYTYIKHQTTYKQRIQQQQQHSKTAKQQQLLLQQINNKIIQQKQYKNI